MVKTGWRSASVLTLAAVIGMTGAVGAQKPNKQKPRQIPQTDVPPAVPVPATDAAGEELLEQMTSRSAEGLVEVVIADGTVLMDLQGRFMSVMVATPQAGGGQTIACETGHDALTHATAKPIAASKGQKAKAVAPPAPTTVPVRETK